MCVRKWSAVKKQQHIISGFLKTGWLETSFVVSLTMVEITYWDEDIGPESEWEAVKHELWFNQHSPNTPGQPGMWKLPISTGSDFHNQIRVSSFSLFCFSLPLVLQLRKWLEVWTMTRAELSKAIRPSVIATEQMTNAEKLCTTTCRKKIVFSHGCPINFS